MYAFPFNYSGSTGMLNWHHVVSDSDTCAHGRQQSPIDINVRSSTFSRRGEVRINIPDAAGAKLENLGAGLEVVLTNGSLRTADNTYQLAQFHWHTPSEHRINGEHYPMEAHSVFKDSGMGHFPVNAVAQVDDVLTHGAIHAEGQIAVAKVLRKPGDYTHTGPLDFSDIARHLDRNPPLQYTGPLTTPPCTEGVKWYVSSQALPLSVKSYHAAKKLLKFNARYIQNDLGAENLLQLASDG